MKLSNYLFNYLGLIFLIYLSGCAKKSNLKLDNKYQQKEARLFDVPLPLGYELLNNQYEQDSYGIKTQISFSELVDFYKDEMINAGWRMISSFSDIETNLLFEKPHKYILISIRPSSQKKYTQVYIFIKLKNENAS